MAIIGNGIIAGSVGTINSKAPAIINQVSGDVVSFSDGAEDMPIKSLIANIDYKQDLHGYDHPWIGGAGKNLFDISKCIASQANSTVVINGNEFTLTSTNVSWGSNSIEQNSKMNFKAGVAYTFSAYCTVLIRDSNYQSPKLSVRNESNNMKMTANLPSIDNTEQRISFVCTPTEDFTGYFSVVITGSTAGSASVKVRNPMIEIGSSVTDYEPYSNICPISGWTGLSGKRTGKNLFKAGKAAGTTSTSTGITFSYNEDGSITINGQNNGSSASFSVTASGIRLKPGMYKKPVFRTGVGIYVQAKVDDTSWRTVEGGVISSDTFTITDDDAQYDIALRINVSTSTSSETFTDYTVYPYVYLASETDLTYETPVSKDISVNWQDQAGTVYGGTLDAITGLLTLDRESFILNGSTLISTITKLTNVFRFWIFTDRKFNFAGNNLAKVKCDRLTYISVYTTDAPSFTAMDTYPSSLVIKLPIGTCEATAESIAAYLAQNPIQFVLPLATPQTYQLDPVTVNTLLGNNTVYVDCGSVTVDYPADTKLYIDNKITLAVADALNA